MRAWSPKRRLQAACDERMRAKVCTLATAAATGAFILMLLVVSGLSGSTLEDQRFWRQPATAATAATLSRPPGRVHSQPVVTDRPLVGILAQECFTCPGRSYVSTAFVRWVEAAGARVVPIRFYNHTDAELRGIFDSINGLVFPGGLTDIWLDEPYTITARKLWQWAREANDAGDVFPIHGTCLGFQLLHVLESNVSWVDLLIDTNSVTHASTLDFTPAASTSAMFGSMPEDLFAKNADPELNIALENHLFGMPPPYYSRWPVLGDNFDILTTTQDRNGTEYISTAEHKRYPFYGTQWHPEKPAYEFGMPEVPHTLDAIRTSQHLANVFVDAARRSSHAPPSAQHELALLINNWRPVFDLVEEANGDETYDGPDSSFYFDEKLPPVPAPKKNGTTAKNGSDATA